MDWTKYRQLFRFFDCGDNMGFKLPQLGGSETCFNEQWKLKIVIANPLGIRIALKALPSGRLLNSPWWTAAFCWREWKR